MAALLMAGTAFAQVSFTFNRTTKTTADVIVSKDGEITEKITATVAISGATEYKVQDKDKNNGANGALNSLPSVLCIARNTNQAREADPNKYTLTITNNSGEPIQFSKVILKNGAFNNAANWQTENVYSKRIFKIGYKGIEADAVQKCVCNNSASQGDYKGLYRYNSFTAPTPQTVNVGETYELTVSVYTEPGASGMYYGLAEVSLVEPYSLEVGEAGYATLMLGYNAQIPNGVTCYKANVDGNRAVLTEIADNVAGGLDANTPVLVKAPKSEGYVFQPFEDGERSIYPPNEIDTNEGNELNGTLSTKSITPAGTTCYVLAKPEGQEVGFYRATLTEGSFLNNANKAYLPVTAGAGARFLSFDFGTETAIEGVEGENGNVKTEIYDLAGRRVKAAQKGIFIVNGKVVIK